MKYNIFIKKNETYKQQQIALWKNNLQNIPEQRYTWFYDKNPYAKPITVLASIESDAIVGNCSLYQRDIMVGHKKVRIGIASDFAVHEKHRVFGPALKMQRLLVDEATKNLFYFLFAFPNNNSLGLFERVGYERLGEIQSGIKILKSRSWFKRKTHSSILNFIISPIIDLVFACYDWILYFIHSGRRVIRFGYAPEKDYDKLWDQAQKTYSIVGEKTSRYLKWRYADNPAKDYQFINAYDKGGSLRGFVVFSLKAKQVVLEEIFADHNDKNTVEALLSAFIAAMRKQDFEQIIFGYLGDNWILRILKKHFFFIRSENRICLILTEDQGKDKEYLFKADHWFLFESEMDI